MGNPENKVVVRVREWKRWLAAAVACCSLGSGLLAGGTANPAAAVSATTTLFTSSTAGSFVTTNVPAGVCFVKIKVLGGGGGTGYTSGGPGSGATVQAVVRVTPLNTLSGIVAGAGSPASSGSGGLGGTGGGGGGGFWNGTTQRGGGGGGASVVDSSSSVPLVVAGGGGGGGVTGGGGSAGTVSVGGVGTTGGNGGAGGKGGKPNGNGGNGEQGGFGGGPGGGMTTGGGNGFSVGGGGNGTTGGGGGGGADSQGGGNGGTGGAGTGTAGPGNSSAASGGVGDGTGGTGGSGGRYNGYEGGGGGAGGLGFSGGGGGDGADGGGGGGGGYGGGGGGYGGGGGGSSYVVPGGSSITSSAANTGGGQVVISYSASSDGCRAPSKSGTPTATASAGKATVTWTAPATTGGGAITGYVVTSSPTAKTCSTTGTLSCTVSGLKNGTSYTFTVKAQNAYGTGTVSTASNAVVPATTPGKAGTPTGVSGNTSVKISWAAATNGGSAITQYLVTSTPTANTCTTSGALTCTVLGLTDGTGYTFIVSDTNAIGAGPPSTRSTSVTPSTTPSKPGTPSVAAGNAKVAVTWSAPTTNGGAAITGYKVTSSPTAKTCTTASLTCTVLGLKNGTSYTFTVKAKNVKGTGPASTSSSAVTPSTTPGKPGTPTGVSGNSSVKVSWTAATAGGLSITRYLVTSTPTAKTCTTAGGLTCTVVTLKNGTSYTFTVKAQNSDGTGTASTGSTAVTPSTIPGQPGIPTATPGSAKVKVTWTAPATNGGAAITGYKVTSSPTAKSCTTASLTCTVLGLKNGTSYTFTVKAKNVKGTGPASTSSSAVTPSTTPGKPAPPTAVSGNASALVTWTAPTTGGAAITGYKVTSTPTGKTCSTTGTLSCTVSSLKNGTSYTFKVVAKNFRGTGTASTSSSAVTPSTTPGKPSAPTAVAHNGTVSVSWSAPTTGGAAITGYKVTSAPTGKTCSTTGTLSCTVSGLNNGTSYTFTVVAQNLRGTGTVSTASSAVTPSTTPGKPSAPTAISGNASALVTWTAPTTGGAAITGYKVTSTPTGKTCSTTGTLSCTVSGLKNGTSYTFTVIAKNLRGTGTISTASSAVTPSTTPGKPSAPTATSGNASAQVTWTAPTTGGAAITGYKVTSTPTGKTCSTTGTLSCTVSGLNNGTSYTFTVVAQNLRGTGAVSTASSAVTPSTTPGKPSAPSATSGNASALVTWTAPTTGGASITGYKVTSSPTGKTCSTTGTLSCTVSGLNNGTSYTFTVVAQNLRGTGAVSTASSAVTPSTTPGKPTAPSATSGNASAQVTWTAPTTGGAAITGYKVTSSPTGKTCSTTGTLSCTVSGLKNGTSYTFTVAAKNLAGTGTTSTASAAVTPSTTPGKAPKPTATSGNASAQVTWTAPTTGGASITGYKVTSTPTGKTCSTTGTLSCTVSGLKNGTSYTFTVVAQNLRGTGAASTASAAVTPSTTPGKPTTPTVVSGNANAKVTWTAPTTGGAPITGYKVTSSPTGKTCSTTTALSCTVSGLKNGTSYTFTVVAKNLRGTGAASTASAAVTPSTTPGKAPKPTVVSGNANAKVTWTAPTTGGASITGYKVTSNPTGKNCSTTGSLSCTVSGLKNGTSYTFTVVAKNLRGTGAASTASAAVTPSTTPGKSTTPTASAGFASAKVTWTAPTTGGAPITSYKVTSSPTGKTCSTTTALSCTVSGLNNGTSYTFTVVAKNLRGTGAVSTASAAVTPSTLPAPAVTGLTPTKGPIGGNTTVTIVGSNFIGATQVQFGNQSATSFTVEDSTHIKSVNAAASAGSVNVTVTTAAGTSTNTSASQFTFGATDTSVTAPASNGVGPSFTVSANTTSTFGIPAGNVRFTTTSAGTTVTLCSATLTAGHASCAASISRAGTYSISGTYGGSATFAGSVGTATMAVSAVTPAPPPGATSSNSSSSTSSTGTATATVTNLTATGQGAGSVTVATYSSNTTGVNVTDGTGVFYDIAVGTGSNFTSLTAKICNVVTATSLDWFNGTSWVPFSNVRVTGSCLVITVTNTTSPTIADLTGTPVALVAHPHLGKGYYEVASDGGLFAFGVPFFGSMGGKPLNAPIVGVAPNPNAKGYWEVSSDGGIFSFGVAPFYGSMGGKPLNAPIVGMVSTNDGNGYYEVASDGGLFAFGDAAFDGSMGGKALNAPIVGMAMTFDGKGYYEVASDGGLFAFGDAAFDGSMGGKALNAPVVGMAMTPNGKGYYEVASDGGLFAFGDAAFDGSMGGKTLVKPIVGITVNPSGGYYEVASDGGLFAFGNAPFLGSEGNQPLASPIVGMTD